MDFLRKHDHHIKMVLVVIAAIMLVSFAANKQHYCPCMMAPHADQKQAQQPTKEGYCGACTLGIN